jgi:hypothetical protein
MNAIWGGSKSFLLIDAVADCSFELGNGNCYLLGSIRNNSGADEMKL